MVVGSLARNDEISGAVDTSALCAVRLGRINSHANVLFGEVEATEIIVCDVSFGLRLECEFANELCINLALEFEQLPMHK
jgi:hypothetical protein